MSANLMFYNLVLLKFHDTCNYFLIKFIRQALFYDFNLMNKYFINIISDYSHNI